MKGQMFILTMVFLAGLVFAIQTSLSEYNFLDLSESFEDNEVYLFDTIRNSFEDTVASSLTCEEAENNLAELKEFIDKRVIKGTSVGLDYTTDCNQWTTTDPVVNLTISLKSVSIDATETTSF